MNKYYVYRHVRLDKNEPFYVGKGSGNRAWSFYNRNPKWNSIKNKSNVKVEIIEVYTNEQEAFCKEVELIKSYRESGYNLANLTDGGEGTSGIVRSKETRENMSKAQKEKYKKQDIWNKGLKLPKQAEARKGSGNPMYGRKQTDKYYEGRKKMLGGKNPSARKVIDTKTGIIYGSIKEASESLNMNVNTLRGYINGHRPNKTNLEYIRK